MKLRHPSLYISIGILLFFFVRAVPGVPAALRMLSGHAELSLIMVGSVAGLLLGAIVPLALAYAQWRTAGRIGPGVTLYACFFLVAQPVLMYFAVTHGGVVMSGNAILRFALLHTLPLIVLAVCGVVSYLNRERK